MSDLQAVAYYGILDASYVAPQDWLAKYDALVAGGAGLIQIRAKDATPAERRALVDQVVEHRAALRSSLSTLHSPPQPPLIVNDDIELALAYPDLGLHVGQDDLPAAEARKRLGSRRILGLSTHSPEQALAAIDLGPKVLTYFAVGPVFATRTKPDYTPVGLELVRFVARQSPQLPFFCIGGINRGNVAQVREAGARRVVTVSDVLLADDTAAATRQTIETLSSRSAEP